MIDLIELDKEREKVCFDKAELFDFYYNNWDNLVKEIESLRKIILDYDEPLVSGGR